MDSKTTLSISEARKKIFQIAQDVQKAGRYYTLTENGRPKAVILSAEEFESIVETLDVLSDPELMKDIDQAEKEYARGEYVTWEDLKEELGYFPQPGEFVAADKGKRKYTTKRKKSS